jgi:hypothetical protein
VLLVWFSAPPLPGSADQRTWRIRPYKPSDFAALVNLQTDSFHSPKPFKAFDKLAKTNLRAEVRLDAISVIPILVVSDRSVRSFGQ